MNKVFVFGSNLKGRHGKGAARFAAEFHGAKEGIGYGMMWDNNGNSCFAIPTKFTPYETLPLNTIEHYVNCFIDYTLSSDSIFQVTPIGCGLAGYTPEQIAPFFYRAKGLWNIELPEEFKLVLNGMTHGSEIS